MNDRVPRYVRIARSIALAGAATLGCAKNEPEAKPPVATPSESSASSTATTVEPKSGPGCFCRKHKSDSDPGKHELCKVGDVDFQGNVCEAGDPAEGPLPPPDLPSV